MKQFVNYTLATLVGLFLFFFVGIFLLFGIIGSIAAVGSQQTTTLEPNSVYVIELEGILEERSQEDEVFNMAISKAMGSTEMTVLGLDDLLKNIQRASTETSIKGIYLKGGNLSASYASLSELRNALLRFKDSGKWIVAYADTYTQSNYYLASVADKIMLNKEGMLSWGGLYSETMFYKNLLDKIGVKMQVIKVGTFKSAVEPFIATEMSEPNRIQVTKMITDIWTEIISQVADSRQISAAKLQNYADENMLYSPTQDYVTSGLIDTLVYEQEVNEVLKTLLNTKEVKTVSNKEMKVLPDLMLEARNPKIAILYAVGDITDDAGDGIVGKEMLKTIEKVKSDSTIKGVVLRVNSPGGSAFASEQIWYALTQLKKDKPLVVSMGDYAASGGYYIACMADAIVAQPTTLTGSIGIFGMVPDLSGMMDKIGLNYDGVGTNKRSNMETSMIMGMNAETHELIQAHVNRGYELFVKRCADGRDLTVQDIKNIAEGRVWTGIAAMQNGLVDTLGGIQDAINMAADMAELEKYRVVEFPKKKDALTILMEELSPSLNDASQNNLHHMWRRFNEIKHRPYSLEAIMPMEINIR